MYNVITVNFFTRRSVQVVVALGLVIGCLSPIYASEIAPQSTNTPQYSEASTPTNEPLSGTEDTQSESYICNPFPECAMTNHQPSPKQGQEQEDMVTKFLRSLGF